MQTTKSLMDSDQKPYLENISDIEQLRADGNARTQEMLAWIKVDIESDERIITMLEDYCAVKQYVYRVTEVPSESLVLGHTLKRYAEENLG